MSYFASVGIMSNDRDDKGYRKVVAHYVVFSPGRVVRNDDSTHNKNVPVNDWQFQEAISFAHWIGYKVLYNVHVMNRPSVWAHVEIKGMS